MSNITVYARARAAKKSLKTKNRLGWPNTEDGIRTLFNELSEDEQVAVLCGRFVKSWDGSFKFYFPATTTLIETMEGLLPLRKDIIFKEDTE